MNKAIYNPNNILENELPIIYGFNNGGSPRMEIGVLMAEDGTCLGSHCCSHESFMYGDLGITEGYRPDRHESFKKHYPNGYRMDFVSKDDVLEHEHLMTAIKLNEKQAKEAEAEDIRKVEELVMEID